MKTGHQLLKEISDLIGYESNFKYCELNKEFYEDLKTDEGYERQIDVREIIFTPEFMEKFFYYYRDKNNYNFILHGELGTKQLIFKHLDNPVGYLVNLLNINQN